MVRFAVPLTLVLAILPLGAAERRIPTVDDPARIGCMGWSQGGYISAFLTTSSDRFKAISVGAGISNWATYYYNTDIRRSRSTISARIRPTIPPSTRRLRR